MKYFKERKTDFTACLKDGDLVLTVENALKNCLSEKGIQLVEPQIPLKLGRNNITGKNVKEKTNLKIQIQIDGQTKVTERNNTERCAKQSLAMSQESDNSNKETGQIQIFLKNYIKFQTHGCNVYYDFIIINIFYFSPPHRIVCSNSNL